MSSTNVVKFTSEIGPASQPQSVQDGECEICVWNFTGQFHSLSVHYECNVNSKSVVIMNINCCTDLV